MEMLQILFLATPPPLHTQVKILMFNCEGGFSSLGLFCLYKHLLTKSKGKIINTV